MVASMETLIPEFWFLPAFFSLFCLIYAFAQCVVFRSWSLENRGEASSCLISLAHGTPAALMGAWVLLANSHQSFASANTSSQDLVLDYSIAYFLVDLLHLLISCPADYLFIAHHLATLFVFITCRYLVFHGAFAILVLLVLAEVTSACQNVWTLAGIRKTESAIAARVHSLLSPPFYAVYTLARGFAGPACFYQMSVFYLRGKASDVIPWWVSLLWIVVIGGAISVSILWVLNHWLELYRERIGSAGKKMR